MSNSHSELQQAWTQKLVRQIASTPSFGDHLLQDPKAALEANGLWEEYLQVNAAMGPDVVGYTAGGHTGESASGQFCCIFSGHSSIIVNPPPA